MPKTLAIVDISTPEGRILRQIAELVRSENISSLETQGLIDDMMTTYKSAGLVGLAAPQVGMSERIVIVSSEPRPTYRNAPVIEPFAMINPLIVGHSEEKIKGWEGCGSMKNAQGYPRAKIWRNKEVSVIFLDRDGRLTNRRFEGFIARVIQHEIDHLDGIMFTDRKLRDDRLYEENEYRALIAEEEKQ